MLQQKFNWSESSTGILSQMAESGNTATDVATTLGCTRSAVLGKAKRLGVSFSHGKNGRPLGSTAKPPSQWTEERITRAAELWARGVSSGAIAEEIGSSQNALLSLMDRRRDQFPHRRGRSATQPKKQRIVPVKPIEKIERVNGTFKFDSVPFLLPEFPGIKFIDLEAQHCKFPVSNDAGPDLLCCGANRLEGHPYCGVHLSISRGRGTRSEQMALDGRVWK